MSCYSSICETYLQLHERLCNKNKESTYLKYSDVNTLYGCQYQKSYLYVVLKDLKIYHNLVKIS